MLRLHRPLLLLALAAAPAFAEDAVPDIAPDALPAAGTCAPIDARDATFVTVGPTGLLFRVEGRSGTYDDAGLTALLAERAGARPAGTPSRHSVWIAAEKDKPARFSFRLVQTCNAVGIFRVGLRVRSDAGPGVYGFPLFVPATTGAAAPGAPAGRAKRLDVKVEANSKSPSDPNFLYEAARRATEKFGPVVADVTVHGAARLEDAVASLDMLWRGGCAGIRMSLRGLLPGFRGLSGLRVWIQDREVAHDGSSVTVPPVAPRTASWGDDGPAQPGASTWALEDLPGLHEAKDPLLQVLPNYAREPSGVPEEVRRESDAAIAAWARALAKDLGEATRGRPVSAGRIVQRASIDAGNTARLLAPAKESFPAAERIIPATLRVQVLLFEGAKSTGRVDVTLHLGGQTPSVLFASWNTEPLPPGLVLAPEKVDPFAGGLAGRLRVWIEAFLATAKQGPSSVPLAPDREVLQLVPAVAYAGLQVQLAGRMAQVDVLSRWLKSVTYDRVVLLAPEGSAAVWSRGRIEGVFRFALEPEAFELRIATLAAKVAPPR